MNVKPHENIIAYSLNKVFSKDHLSVLGGCGYVCFFCFQNWVAFHKIRVILYHHLRRCHSVPILRTLKTSNSMVPTPFDILFPHSHSLLLLNTLWLLFHGVPWCSFLKLSGWNFSCLRNNFILFFACENSWEILKIKLPFFLQNCLQGGNFAVLILKLRKHKKED